MRGMEGRKERRESEREREGRKGGRTEGLKEGGGSREGGRGQSIHTIQFCKVWYLWWGGGITNV